MSNLKFTDASISKYVFCVCAVVIPSALELSRLDQMVCCLEVLTDYLHRVGDLISLHVEPDYTDVTLPGHAYVYIEKSFALNFRSLLVLNVLYPANLCFCQWFPNLQELDLYRQMPLSAPDLAKLCYLGRLRTFKYKSSTISQENLFLLLKSLPKSLRNLTLEFYQDRPVLSDLCIELMCEFHDLEILGCAMFQNLGVSSFTGLFMRPKSASGHVVMC